jgi:HD-GYP domain-containing protein (c-di-GMP phosphodiesterase class II)/phosphoribosyl 1,2-cyclic phosphodiesterase
MGTFFRILGGSMEVLVRGVRGSIPVASASTQRYGGNTTCVEVRLGEELLVIDAGSGIRALGEEIMTAGPVRLHLCFTHAHWDHLLGFPMFAPIFSPHTELHIHAPRTIGGSGVQAVLSGIMDRRYFPVKFESLPAQITIHEFEPGESFSVGSAQVATCPTVHPGGNVAYAITHDGWRFVFTGDHEWRPNATDALSRGMERFLEGATVALVDAQYTEDEYAVRQGWGHSAMDAWPRRAARAGVHTLLLSHHDPARSDEDVEALEDLVRRRFADLPVDIRMAAEGMRIGRWETGVVEVRHEPVPQKGQPFAMDDTAQGVLAWINVLTQELSRYADMGALLDRILLEGRRITSADAGTIFLVDGGGLSFAYTQNDTLFPGSAASKYVYVNAVLPLDSSSVAGHVASTGKAVNIPDMYHIPASEPYRFNEAFDRKTGYRTVSTLTVPVFGQKGRILGVMQLINSMEDGKPRPFTIGMQMRVNLLAAQAGAALERGLMTQALLLRMLKMAELRDPRETGAHVQRVGAYAAEIYHRWAERHGVDPDELRYTKGKIRTAAMLHDVGKVGIPDVVLKKPGRLNDEELRIMRSHCVLGAALFADGSWDVDDLVRDVILHHHQKWDGTGYTGSEEPPLAGEAIPLVARIVAVADVYDALCSRRCYKEAWSPEDAVAIIRKDAGTHFDPEVVSCFEEIFETIEAIRARYPDEPGGSGQSSQSALGSSSGVCQRPRA